MRAVFALGGNALLPANRALTFEVQRETTEMAAAVLAPVIAGHEVVVTHGNGPQVGLLALQAEALPDVAAYPLDVLVAESEGMIGYLLETALEQVIDRPLLTVLTRTVVDPDDPAFSRPTKPIGPVYEDGEAARRMASQRGWELREVGGGLRRVVPSPAPLRIVQSPLLRSLLEAGVVVICTGGGGIPVVERPPGSTGVAAVVDKDLASSQLARELEADLLVCLTDVDAVYEGWGGGSPQAIRAATPAWLRGREWEPGSMGPKVEAAAGFVDETGGRACIGRLDLVAETLAGTAGTTVRLDGPDVELWSG